ncbi:hypothetical protein CK516_07520 [Nostoc sp. 'Peltigera malacea cyanobiont' DB3992]|nr:hypothetical protein CK516_07520 [Nostoc sp. 'Peltigera malacea cyanobiont' DB3992]
MEKGRGQGAGGREQGAGRERILALFIFLHTVWFYCADLLNALPSVLGKAIAARLTRLRFSGFS